MSLSKDFIWVAAGRFAAAVVGIATIRISTLMLPPEQFGILAMLITFQTFAGLFLINPVGQYINRHTHEWADEGSLLPRLRRFYRWVSPAALVSALGGLSWALSQSISLLEQILVGGLVMFMIVASTANATTLYILNMLGYRALATGWATATVLLGLGFSVLLTHIFDVGLAWFAGQALGMTIGAVGATKVLHRFLPASGSTDWPLLEPGVLRNYILPLAMATGFMWWLLSGHRLLLEAQWGLAALGSAVVGLSLASQLWTLLETLAMQFLYPMFFRRIAAINSPDRTSAFSDLLNTLGPVYLVMAAATIIAAPALLKLFVDGAYANVLPFVIVGAVIECCRALGNVLGIAAQVERRMGALIIPYGLGASILTIGLLLYDSEGGIFDAILILIGSVALSLISMTIVMKRLQRFQIDYMRWCFASILVLFSIPLLGLNPLPPKDFGTAFEWVALTGTFAAIATFMLLWKNPGCMRLLNVRLQPKTRK